MSSETRKPKRIALLSIAPAVVWAAALASQPTPFEEVTGSAATSKSHHERAG